MILQNGQRSDEQRYHTFILDRIAMLISNVNETFIRRKSNTRISEARPLL